MNTQFCQDYYFNKKAEEIILFCKDSLLKVYPQNDIQGLILTGSFARGEGSIVEDKDKVFTILGDIEFMVVFPGRKGLVEKHLALAEISNQISNDLSQRGMRCEVEFTPVAISYFKDTVPTIFSIELRENGKGLYGSRDFLKEMHHFTVSDIPKEDAFNLLSNRIIEQLILYERITSGKNLDFFSAIYQITKLYLDIGGSFLAFTGNYETTYANRIKKLKQLLEEKPVNRTCNGIDVAALYQKVERYTQMKLYPQQELYSTYNQGHKSESDIREYLLSKLLTASDYVKALWMWEVKELYNMDENFDLSNILKRIRHRENYLSRLKGWLKLTIIHFKYKKKFSFYRILSLLSKGSPRNLVNMCAAQAYFLLNISDLEKEIWIKKGQKHIRNLIPVLYNQESMPEERLLNYSIINIIKNWENYLKNF